MGRWSVHRQASTAGSRWYPSPAMPKARSATVVGVSDHAGWAILVTASDDGALVDRRRVALVEDGIPCMPHHHDGQRLPLDEAVALVDRVRDSATRAAGVGLDALVAALPRPPSAIALRASPPLPATVAERITNYRAMCVADWVMYRSCLADAARARGIDVSTYDPATVLDEAAAALGAASLDPWFAKARAQVGAPWQKDHRLAMAAAIVAARAASAR